MSTETDNTENDSKSKPDRRYICTSCDGVVRARWFGPGSFEVGCDCTTVPVVPQMGQGETPDKWIVERPTCCSGVDVTKLDVVYGERGVDCECPTCGAQYSYNGSFVGEPTDETYTMARKNNKSLGDFANE